MSECKHKEGAERADAEKRARVIEAYCRLSATVDARLDSTDADLAQLAIGCVLKQLGVDLTSTKGVTKH